MANTEPLNGPTKAQKLSAEVETLRAQHGRIVHQVIDGELYAWRAPEQDEFEDYQEKRQKGTRPGVCYREFAQVCCLTDLDKLKALFKKYPALPLEVANNLAELAGASIELVMGKD